VKSEDGTSLPMYSRGMAIRPKSSRSSEVFAYEERGWYKLTDVQQRHIDSSEDISKAQSSGPMKVKDGTSIHVYNPSKKRGKRSKGIARAQRSRLTKSENGMSVQEHRGLAMRRVLTL
jgi:hypothetical protein